MNIKEQIEREETAFKLVLAVLTLLVMLCFIGMLQLMINDQAQCELTASHDTCVLALNP